MGTHGYSGNAAATALAPASFVNCDNPTKNSRPGIKRKMKLTNLKLRIFTITHLWTERHLRRAWRFGQQFPPKEYPVPFLEPHELFQSKNSIWRLVGNSSEEKLQLIDIIQRLSVVEATKISCVCGALFSI